MYLHPAPQDIACFIERYNVMQDWVCVPTIDNKPEVEGWENLKQRQLTRAISVEHTGMALITGQRSRVVALNMSKDGTDYFEALYKNNSGRSVPKTRACNTPLGGRYYLFNYSIELSGMRNGLYSIYNERDILVRWEFCTDGGYVPLPPYQGHRWTPTGQPEKEGTGDCPDWLLEMLRKGEAEPIKQEMQQLALDTLTRSKDCTPASTSIAVPQQPIDNLDQIMGVCIGASLETRVEWLRVYTILAEIANRTSVETMVKTCGVMLQAFSDVDAKTDVDYMNTFIREMCDENPEGRTSMTELHARYLVWAKARGERAHSRIEFGRQLSGRNYEIHRGRFYMLWGWEMKL